MELVEVRRPEADGEEPVRHLVVFVLVALVSAVVPFAIASVTTGAVNAVTWFAFCMAAAAAILGTIACVLRFGDWAFRRARRSVSGRGD